MSLDATQSDRFKDFHASSVNRQIYLTRQMLSSKHPPPSQTVENPALTRNMSTMLAATIWQSRTERWRADEASR